MDYLKESNNLFIEIDREELTERYNINWNKIWEHVNIMASGKTPEDNLVDFLVAKLKVEGVIDNNKGFGYSIRLNNDYLYLKITYSEPTKPKETIKTVDNNKADSLKINDSFKVIMFDEFDKALKIYNYLKGICSPLKIIFLNEKYHLVYDEKQIHNKAMIVYSLGEDSLFTYDYVIMHGELIKEFRGQSKTIKH